MSGEQEQIPRGEASAEIADSEIVELVNDKKTVIPWVVL
jgi:hypothetical protein